MIAVGSKRCTKCGKRKTCSSFHVYRRASDGLQFHCKACRSKSMAVLYKKQTKRILQRNRDYIRKNRSKVARYKRAYYEAHRENYNRNLRAWRTKNWQHHYINHQAKRQALIRGATVSDFTLEDWIELLEACGYVCTYCGSTAKLTMDHVVPLSKGGNHTKGNIAPACQPCNSRKNDSVL